MKNIATTISTVLVFVLGSACGAPPPVVETDAGIVFPDPEPIDAATWAALEEAHGDVACAAPQVQTLTHAEYLALTGVCGSGAGRDCERGRIDGDVIIVTVATSPNAIVHFAFEYVATCEGAPFDQEGYLDTLDALDLR